MMRVASDEEKEPKRDQGFVLATVLWIAGLLAILAATFSLSVRSHVRVAANIGESAAAEALADGGVSLAILDLVLSSKEPARIARFPSAAAGAACSVQGQGRLVIAVSDEGARIDINSAGIPILQALIAGLGEPPERALSLAEAIFDYRDGDDTRRENGAERAEYLAAGMAWTPKNAAFDTPDELGQVYGMTPALIDRMRPHIGVRSGLAGIDMHTASPALTALLRKGVERSGARFSAFSDLDPEHPLPAIFNTPAPRRLFAVHVEAVRPGGARFVREAVVEITRGQGSAYAVKDWRQGVPHRDVIVPNETAPDC